MKFLLFLFLSVSALPASGSKHTCRVLFLNGPDDAPDKLQLFDGAKCQEVELPRMNLSKVYDLPAGALSLRMLPSPAPADLTKIPTGAPAVNVPEAVEDFYLLLSSDPANAVAPVRMQVIDASAGKLKAGQMLWYNLTKNRVGGILGSEKLAMEADSRAVVNSPASGNDDYSVNLTYLPPGDQQLRPLCETKWRHDPRSRSVAFIISQNGVRAPRVLVFPDYREKEEEKKK